MKIYYASRYGRREEVYAYAKEMELLGAVNVARWLTGVHDSDPDTDEGHRAYAIEDLHDIELCDIFVLFPGTSDRSPSRGGHNVELGYAIGLRKRIIIVGSHENIFHYSAAFYQTWEGAKKALIDAINEEAVDK